MEELKVSQTKLNKQTNQKKKKIRPLLECINGNEEYLYINLFYKLLTTLSNSTRKNSRLPNK